MKDVPSMRKRNILFFHFFVYINANNLELVRKLRLRKEKQTKASVTWGVTIRSGLKGRSSASNLGLNFFFSTPLPNTELLAAEEDMLSWPQKQRTLQRTLTRLQVLSEQIYLINSIYSQVHI